MMRVPQAVLHGSTLAQEGAGNDPGPSPFCNLRRSIHRTIIHNDHLADLWIAPGELHGRANGLRLIERGNDYRDHEHPPLGLTAFASFRTIGMFATTSPGDGAVGCESCSHDMGISRFATAEVRLLSDLLPRERPGKKEQEG